MDSNDLPLNVSREILQESRIVSTFSRFRAVVNLFVILVPRFIIDVYCLLEGANYEEAFSAKGL